MSELTASGSAIDDLPDMWDGFMRMVRPGLGLSAFGANIMNLPPDYSTKSHDESGSGQEELYVRLAGDGWIVLDESGEKLALDAEHLCAVGPGTARALASGPDGLRVLIVGSAPGAATRRSTTAGSARRFARYAAIIAIARSAAVSSPSSLCPRLATSSSASASSARRSAAASVARASLMRRSAVQGPLQRVLDLRRRLARLQARRDGEDVAHAAGHERHEPRQRLALGA